MGVGSGGGCIVVIPVGVRVGVGLAKGGGREVDFLEFFLGWVVADVRCFPCRREMKRRTFLFSL